MMTWRSSISARTDDSTGGISPTNKQKLKIVSHPLLQTKNKQRNGSLGAQIGEYF
jgi:hypothetical protein